MRHRSPRNSGLNMDHLFLVPKCLFACCLSERKILEILNFVCVVKMCLPSFILGSNSIFIFVLATEHVC